MLALRRNRRADIFRYSGEGQDCWALASRMDLPMPA
jgi:hypothetical protein